MSDEQIARIKRKQQILRIKQKQARLQRQAEASAPEQEQVTRVDTASAPHDPHRQMPLMAGQDAVTDEWRFEDSFGEVHDVDFDEETDLRLSRQHRERSYKPQSGIPLMSARSKRDSWGEIASDLAEGLIDPGRTYDRNKAGIDHPIKRLGRRLQFSDDVIISPIGEGGHEGQKRTSEGLVKGFANFPGRLLEDPAQTVYDDFLRPAEDAASGLMSQTSALLRGDVEEGAYQAKRAAGGIAVTAMNSLGVKLARPSTVVRTGADGFVDPVIARNVLDGDTLNATRIGRVVGEGSVPNPDSAAALPRKARNALDNILARSGAEEASERAAIIADVEQMAVEGTSSVQLELQKKYGAKYPGLSQNLDAIAREMSQAVPEKKGDMSNVEANTGFHDVVMAQRDYVEEVAEETFGPGAPDMIDGMDESLNELSGAYNKILEPFNNTGNLSPDEITDPIKMELELAEGKLTKRLERMDAAGEISGEVKDNLVARLNKHVFHPMGQRLEKTADDGYELVDGKGNASGGNVSFKELIGVWPTQIAHHLQSSLATVERSAAKSGDMKGTVVAQNAADARGKSAVKPGSQDLNEAGYGLLNDLENAVPGYKEVREKYGTEMGVLDAIELPRQFMSVAKDEVKLADFIKTLGKLTPQQLKGAKSRITSLVRNQLHKRGETPTLEEIEAGDIGIVPNFTELVKIAPALEKAFGKDGKKLADAIRLASARKNAMYKVNPEAQSRTSPNQIAVRDAPGLYEKTGTTGASILDTAMPTAVMADVAMSAVMTPVTGGIPLPISSGARLAWNAYRKSGQLSGKEKTALAKYLFAARKGRAPTSSAADVADMGRMRLSVDDAGSVEDMATLLGISSIAGGISAGSYDLDGDGEKGTLKDYAIGTGLGLAGFGGINFVRGRIRGPIEHSSNASKRPTTGKVQIGSGAQGGLDSVREAASKVFSKRDRLKGLPETVTIPGHGPVKVERHQPARDAAVAYMASKGMRDRHPTYVEPVNPERSMRIADAFEAMEHAPNDPKVMEAYEAMAQETLEQYEFVLQTGLEVEFADPRMPDPYEASPRLAIEDVKNNNHLWVFPTDTGYGMAAFTAEEIAENPMLRLTDYEISGRPARVNDIFRIVHDYFGHIQEGNGFRANGEETAWRIHGAMYSNKALPAVTSETRGQNSWLNYGPHGEANRTASTENTVFAEQKIGIMEDWTWKEGRDPRSFWDDEAGMFGGFNAKGADMTQQARAQKMIDEGYDPEEIFDHTGWMLYGDGQWRFEIDDTRAQVIPQNLDVAVRSALVADPWAGGVTMGEVFYHPELYARYPQLASVKIGADRTLDKGSYGYFTAGGQGTIGRIALNPEMIKSMDSGLLRGGLIHEMQHAVQHLEGFPQGGTPAKDGMDTLHFDRKLDEVWEGLSEGRPETFPTRIRRTMQRLDEQGVDLRTASKEDFDAAMEAGERLPMYDRVSQQFLRDNPDRVLRHMDVMSWAAEDIAQYQDGQRWSDVYMLPSGARMINYLRLFGEAEARMAEVRSHMSPEEKLTTWPMATIDAAPGSSGLPTGSGRPYGEHLLSEPREEFVQRVGRVRGS